MNALKAWVSQALSEDGEPSASRLMMTVWAIGLLVGFFGFAAWEAYHTQRMPDVRGWGEFLGVSQAGGSLSYISNKLSRAFGPKEK